MKSYLIILDSNSTEILGRAHGYIGATFSARGRIFLNTRLVFGDKSAAEIRNGLVLHLGGTFGIIVSKTGGSGARRNVRCDNSFIKRYL